MTDPLRELVAIVRTSCQQEQEGATDTIDVGFFHVSFMDDVMDSKDAFVVALDACIDQRLGEFGSFDAERIGQGPSYIEVGGWIGDQGTALCFFALGEKYDLWRVITPARVGFTRADPEYDQLIGSGMVLLSGYKK